MNYVLTLKMVILHILGKISIPKIYVKKAKNSLQARIDENSIMSHNEAKEGLYDEIRGV